jgi:hypothetical protein
MYYPIWYFSYCLWYLFRPTLCVRAGTALCMGLTELGPPKTFLEKYIYILKYFILAMQQTLLTLMLHPICVKGLLSSWMTVKLR